MFHQKFLTYTFLIFLFKSAKVYAGLSEKEWDEMMKVTSHAFEGCIEEFGISSSESEKMYIDPDYDYDPLFISCYFTNVGLMDKGLFNIKKSMDFSKLYVKREDELARLHKIRQECSKVNKAKVSDDEDGYAERAMLLFDCLEENGDDIVLVEEKYRKSG